MKRKTTPPLPELNRLFHEPKRLALLIQLCLAEKGATFTELKAACDLTDGNLNRHLKMLEDHRIVRTQRLNLTNRPYTLVQLNAQGKKRFQRYLLALDTFLKRAQKATKA